MISLSKSLPSSNKIEILSKPSKDTNEASSCVNPKPCLQHTCSLVYDAINFICYLELFKTINRSYSDVADSLITTTRSINYDIILRSWRLSFRSDIYLLRASKHWLVRAVLPDIKFVREASCFLNISLLIFIILLCISSNNSFICSTGMTITSWDVITSEFLATDLRPPLTTFQLWNIYGI